MKTNPPTSKFGNLLGTQASRLRAFGTKRNVTCASFLLAFFIVLLLFAFLTACKSPAILTNADNHHSRDSNYHSNYQLIETHDTIILGLTTKKSPFKGDLEGLADLEGLPIIRISDRTRTIRDTTFILRTDTLLRTQTITQTERYIPPFYKFCTITLATIASLATLYLVYRSNCSLKNSSIFL